MIFNGNRESTFFTLTSDLEEGIIGRIYGGAGDAATDNEENNAALDIKGPGGEAGIEMKRDKNAGKKNAKPDYESETVKATFKKKGTPSIFNRYEIFYFDNFSNSPNGFGEPLYDSPDRLSKYITSARKDSAQSNVLKNPTAQNIINWSKSGQSNAIEYDWADFLWCKNYGIVPNNYMVTLRRFALPAADDLFFIDKSLAPDIARMVTWVDGETNKWESVGLKFSTSMTWKKFESEIQSINVGDTNTGYGNEGGAMEGAGGIVGLIGGAMTTFSKLLDTDNAKAQRQTGNREPIDPYHDTMKVHGPIDVIKEMMIREKGLNFDQTFTLTFEYELRSIDGVNSKIAFMDLLANVMQLTSNKGKFWGGEIKYWGSKGHQKVKPLGDPQKLANGDYGGYLNSLMSNVEASIGRLTQGKDVFSPEGFTNLLKGMGSNLMDSVVGGGLDKMGRPGAIAVNSLLTGEDTGNWHVMVGNPANPIISVGNLIMEKTDVEFDGPLGPDDFPTKLKVICTLKPARPRERLGILDMFHRNGRIYTTVDPIKLGVKKVTRKTKKSSNQNQSNNQSTGTQNQSGENKNSKIADANMYIVSEGKTEEEVDARSLYNERFSNWLNAVTNNQSIIAANAAGIF
jgi:hypothetical protein